MVCFLMFSYPTPEFSFGHHPMITSSNTKSIIYIYIYIYRERERERERGILQSSNSGVWNNSVITIRLFKLRIFKYLLKYSW